MPATLHGRLLDHEQRTLQAQANVAERARRRQAMVREEENAQLLREVMEGPRQQRTELERAEATVAVHAARAKGGTVQGPSIPALARKLAAARGMPLEDAQRIIVTLVARARAGG
jgi:hypothetical protein